MTQPIVLTAMLLLQPRLFGRILDDFWGWFLLFFNVSFSFITSFGRYLLNSTYADKYPLINILVGKMSSHFNFGQKSIFWPFFLCTTVGVSWICSLIIVIKKIVIYRKEKNLVQQLNLGRQFNNVRYNQAVLKSPLLIGWVLFMITVALLMNLNRMELDDEMSRYLLRFCIYNTVVFVFKLVFPLMVMLANTKLSKSMLNSLKECFCTV